MVVWRGEGRGKALEVRSKNVVELSIWRTNFIRVSSSDGKSHIII